MAPAVLSGTGPAAQCDAEHCGTARFVPPPRVSCRRTRRRRAPLQRSRHSVVNLALDRERRSPREAGGAGADAATRLCRSSSGPTRLRNPSGWAAAPPEEPGRQRKAPELAPRTRRTTFPFVCSARPDRSNRTGSRSAGARFPIGVGACNHRRSCSQTERIPARIICQWGTACAHIICHCARHHRVVLANGGSCSQSLPMKVLAGGGRFSITTVSDAPQCVMPQARAEALSHSQNCS